MLLQQPPQWVASQLIRQAKIDRSVRWRCEDSALRPIRNQGVEDGGTIPRVCFTQVVTVRERGTPKARTIPVPKQNLTLLERILQSLLKFLLGRNARTQSNTHAARASRYEVAASERYKMLVLAQPMNSANSPLMSITTGASASVSDMLKRRTRWFGYH